MIKHSEFLEQTQHLKPVFTENNYPNWVQDFFINNRLIRYTSSSNPEWVHVIDMFDEEHLERVT